MGVKWIKDGLKKVEERDARLAKEKLKKKLIEIPKELQKEEFKFILVKKRDKLPIEKWQDNNYKFDDPKLLNHIKNDGNYGIICGNGLIVIDADTNKLNQIVINELPLTFSVKTAKGFHYYYFVLGFHNKKVLKDEKEHLGEIQSNGTYVIAPNSVHPSGDIYINSDHDIAEVSKENIDKVFSKYYSNERITKDIILTGASKGIRNDLMFKLACSFREKDMTQEEVYITLATINRKNNPPLDDQELKTIVQSAFKYKNEKKEDNKPNTTFYLPIDNYQDNALRFYEYQPYFYDKNQLFWFWNDSEHKYEIVDEVDVMDYFDKILGFKGQTISNRYKSNILEGMKRVGRNKIPKNAKKHWIQLKDKAFSLTSKVIYDVTPDFFFTNPIPWELGESDETPIMDKLFTEWVGEENKELLYEIIAYCCYPDYPIHLVFCLIGCGRNGKSKFLELLNRFIGSNNICSTELDTLLNSRFESFKLYKKLICTMGETNFGILNKTSLLKRLTGQDLVGFEYKNKMPFDDHNYAKILIASNSLPSSEDTSEGFYRRWHIISFDRVFPEGKDILETIPEHEYRNLARKVTNILPILLEKHEFTNQGTIEERKAKFILSSNPLPLFIDLCCSKDPNSFIRYGELYTAYVRFLDKMKRRIVSKREFLAVLTQEGYEIQRTTKKINDVWSSDRYILGLELIYQWEELVKSSCHLCRSGRTSHLGLMREGLGEKCVINDISVMKQGKVYHNIDKQKNISESIDYEIEEVKDVSIPKNLKDLVVETIKKAGEKGINDIDLFETLKDHQIDEIIKIIEYMKTNGEIIESKIGYLKMNN